MIENNDKDKNDVNGPDSHLHICIHFARKRPFFRKESLSKKNGEKPRSCPILSNFFNCTTSFLHVAVELFSLALVYI